MSIRVRLLLLVLGAVLLPVILVGWRYYQDRGKDIDVAISGLTATARTIAANLDAKIQSTTQLHFGLARARDLNGHDKAMCSSFLSDVLDRNPQFTGILTVDPDGRLFCDSLRTGRVLDLRDRDYFKRAVNSINVVVIESVFGRLTGTPVLQIAYPVHNESQRLQFVLLASLDLNKFIKEQTDSLPRGFELILTDHKGAVLLWSPVQRRAVEPGVSINSELLRLTAEGGTKQLVNSFGETQVWSAADTIAVGGVNLHVLVGFSKSELAAAPNQRLAEDVAILGTLALLLFAGVWVLAEVGIRFQISRIATMAERLGSGDLRARIRPPYPSGELGRLMIVLNDTAESLERQRFHIEDLNERLGESRRLEELEKHRLGIAVNNMPQSLLLFDSSHRLIICNQRYIEMFRLSPAVVRPGCSFRDLIAHRKEVGSFSGDIDEYCSSVLRNVKLGKVTLNMAENPDGRTIQIVNQPLADGGWVTTLEDITERKRADERITHLAHFDALTDLPNRVLFQEQLEGALARIVHGEQLALLYIDIDEFKSVNDSLGHRIGDELLKSVAANLRGCLDETDIVARLGGDEFAVVQTAVKRSEDITALVIRIYKSIREPRECLGHMLTTDASIGIALASQDGINVEQLLKNADLAMYSAKAAGRRTHRFFEPEMDVLVKARHSLEIDLRQALIQGDFEVYYQPIVDLQSNRVSGCEALLRWRHPQRGMISPAEFIPVAEETGLINQLGEWVLMTACAEAATWPGNVKIAVNVSPVQFRGDTLALKVVAALAASGLSANRLELEITEAVLIRDDDAALAILHQLRGLGVRIALDDFGTGYSSLSYLQRFPFDKIKIDRCFIKEIADPSGALCIVQAVVSIAAARHITTTAEGVETERQREILCGLGCTEMQGYLFSPAKPAAELKRLLWCSQKSAAIA